MACISNGLTLVRRRQKVFHPSLTPDIIVCSWRHKQTGNMNKMLNRTLVLSTFLGGFSAGGQGQLAPMDAITPVNLEPRPGPSQNRMDMSFRSSFNVNTRFKHIGSLGPRTNPGPASGLAD